MPLVCITEQVDVGFEKRDGVLGEFNSSQVVNTGRDCREDARFEQ